MKASELISILESHKDSDIEFIVSNKFIEIWKNDGDEIITKIPITFIDGKLFTL